MRMVFECGRLVEMVWIIEAILKSPRKQKIPWTGYGLRRAETCNGGKKINANRGRSGLRHSRAYQRLARQQFAEFAVNYGEKHISPNRLTQRFAVDLSEARLRRRKSEVLSIA